MHRALPAARSRVARWIPYAGVGVLALFTRLYPVLHSGGLKGVGGYDDGVYFAASEAVVAGRVPYRDFVLLHPPGLVYLLSPFALLARVVGDANGWAIARVAAMVVGSLSAVLVMLVLRRFGIVASLAGGSLYAVWPPALNAEYSTLLEGPANTLLLASLVLLSRRRRGPGAELLAGAAVGLTAAVKIWGVVPLLIVIGWQLLTRGHRAAGRVAAGGLLAIAAVCAPTLLLAPRRMVGYVVSDQLHRSETRASLLLRAANFTPVSRLWPHASTIESTAGVLMVAALGLICAVVAWTRRSARIFAVLLAAQTAVLLVSPSYFTHYGAYLAPAVALTGGVAGAEVMRRLGRTSAWPSRSFGASAFVAVCLLTLPVFSVNRMAPFHGSRVRAALSGRRCVTADSPTSLLLAGVLSSDLARGCPTQIDVTGVTYGVDRVVGPNGRTVPRVLNPLWQKDILGYLLSGQAAMVTRIEARGFSVATMRVLRSLPVLYRGPDVTVYATNG
jgi:alpha-1,2-mannosyltransferase